jgi:hypothetical protein
MRISASFLALGILLNPLSLISKSSAEEEPTMEVYTIPGNALIDPGGITGFNYDAFVTKDFDKHKKTFEVCAVNGDTWCASWWAPILVERYFTGRETGYEDSEIIFVLRNALCDSSKILESERDGAQLTCSNQYSEATRYLAAIYKLGLLGMPRDWDLSKCWLFSSAPAQTCRDREAALYGDLVLGTKPNLGQ